LRPSKIRVRLAQLSEIVQLRARLVPHLFTLVTLDTDHTWTAMETVLAANKAVKTKRTSSVLSPML
jgi:hypothetical protein